ncbi:hypothetical protein MTO96_042265 [Rhipicephalus appendiculatus]
MKVYIFLALLATALAGTRFEKRCTQKPKVGLCPGKLIRWWFNVEKLRCEMFYYGGCGGNENRHLSQKECEMNCMNPSASVCSRPAHHGPCTRILNRVYYDEKTGTCLPFIYGGCGSNSNNFWSVEDCMRFCGSAKPGKQVDASKSIGK